MFVGLGLAKDGTLVMIGSVTSIPEARRPSMAYSTRTPLADQVESLARQFAQRTGLPFVDVLDAQQLQAALQAEDVPTLDCVYTPLTTVRMLLAQALDPDPSLGQAVRRLLAERAATGQRPSSAATGAYSHARQRLPEGR